MTALIEKDGKKIPGLENEGDTFEVTDEVGNLWTLTASRPGNGFSEKSPAYPETLFSFKPFKDKPQHYADSVVVKPR